MQNNSLLITKCEVCGNHDLTDVLDLGLHPMCDDLVEIGSNRICQEYPIFITYCKNCNTAHQKYQIPKLELFPKTYHYRSRFTKDVLNGMKSLVNDSAIILGDFSQKKVIDIGCNDGSLLTFFKEKGALTYGIEPTDAYKDALESGHLVFNEYLDIKTAKKIVNDIGKFDIITFTNVFAHIEDLNSVLLALKELMHEKTIIIIENHYLGAVIERNQFDTFYHEHPRTYSFNSFLFIAKTLGLDLLNLEFPSRYGGNIRVVLGNASFYENLVKDYSQLLIKESHFFDELVKMNDKIITWKTQMKNIIYDKILVNGKLKGKAFPGRAAILVKLLELDENMISAVYEKPGSMKIGHYLPGTRIPIKSDIELFSVIENEKVILNLAWHIKIEIEKYLSGNNYKGEIINIL
jgi:SAM-dependent methyltransferase